MRFLHPSRSINRLALAIAVLAPIVFFGVYFLRAGFFPQGQDAFRYAGIALAIALAVWLTIHLIALLMDALSPALSRFLEKMGRFFGSFKKFLPQRRRKSSGNSEYYLDYRVIGDTPDDNADDRKKGLRSLFDPDWARAGDDTAPTETTAPRPKRPASRKARTLVVFIGSAGCFILIKTQMNAEWIDPLFTITGAMTVILVWSIWFPGKK